MGLAEHMIRHLRKPFFSSRVESQVPGPSASNELLEALKKEPHHRGMAGEAVWDLTVRFADVLLN